MRAKGLSWRVGYGDYGEEFGMRGLKKVREEDRGGKRWEGKGYLTILEINQI